MDDPLAIKMWRALKAGESIEIHDVEDEDGPPLGVINYKSILEGEELLLKNFAWHFANIIDETDDAETGDVWFQMAIMKDIVYG